MSQDTSTLQQASVRHHCKAVRMPAIGANFVALAEQAVREKRSHIGYLEALLAMEVEERDQHAIDNRLRGAYLPRIKTLEEFDFGKAPQINAAKIRMLAEGGQFLRQGRANPRTRAGDQRPLSTPGAVRHDGNVPPGFKSVQGMVTANATAEGPARGCSNLAK